MANVILDQFVHLKQPADAYLEQGDQISYHLIDLKTALEELNFALRAFITSGKTALAKHLIPNGDLEAIHLCQTHIISLLRESADQISAYGGFAAFQGTEVQHG